MSHVLFREGTFPFISLLQPGMGKFRHTISVCELSQYKKIHLHKHTDEAASSETDDNRIEILHMRVNMNFNAFKHTFSIYSSVVGSNISFEKS